MGLHTKPHTAAFVPPSSVEEHILFCGVGARFTWSQPGSCPHGTSVALQRALSQTMVSWKLIGNGLRYGPGPVVSVSLYSLIFGVPWLGNKGDDLDLGGC